METTETDIFNIFDFPIQHFPDRSARWLLQDKENVRGLIEIVAVQLASQIDFTQLAQLNRSFVWTRSESRNPTSSLVFHFVGSPKPRNWLFISSLNTNPRLM